MNDTDKRFLRYRLVGSIFGWIWLLSFPVTVGLIVYATFFDGPWKYVLFSMLAGGVGKWLLRGFNDHSQRVAVEAFLMVHGASKERASEIWIELYSQGGATAAQQVLNLDEDELAQLCCKD